MLFYFLGGWQTVGEVKPESDMSHDILGLTTNKEYKFRVRAVNKVGSSEPTPLSKVVLAKDPWGMYPYYLEIYFIFVKNLIF